MKKCQDNGLEKTAVCILTHEVFLIPQNNEKGREKWPFLIKKVRFQIVKNMLKCVTLIKLRIF